jgi:hypothetical protein
MQSTHAELAERAEKTRELQLTQRSADRASRGTRTTANLLGNLLRLCGLGSLCASSYVTSSG